MIDAFALGTRHARPSLALVLLGLVAGLVPPASAVANTPDDRLAASSRESAPPSRERPAGRRAVSRDPLPPVTVEPRSLDLGVFRPKSTVSGIIRFTNTGDEPLTVTAVQPSCKCTTVNDLQGSVIEPGETAELEARLDSGSATGMKRASIKVLFDGYTRVIEVPIVGEISEPIRSIPNYINAMRGQNMTGRVVLESVDGEPFTVCSMHGQEPEFETFDPLTDEPRARYVLSYDLHRFDEDAVPMFLLVETDRADAAMVPVRVRHDSVRLRMGIRGARDLSANAGRIDQGSDGTMTLSFKTAPTIEFTGLTSATEDVAYEIIGAGESEAEEGIVEVEVRVTPAPSFTGVLNTTATLQSNRGDHTVRVFGRVVPAGESGCSGTAGPWPPEVAAPAEAAPRSRDSRKRPTERPTTRPAGEKPTGTR